MGSVKQSRAAASMLIGLCASCGTWVPWEDAKEAPWINTRGGLCADLVCDGKYRKRRMLVCQVNNCSQAYSTRKEFHAHKCQSAY